MPKLRLLALSVLIFVIPAHSQQQKTIQVDVCVYGATSAGIIAAYTAKKLHQSVLLVDPGKHIGGLTSGGLGFTDIGNKYAVTGLGLDFYRRVGKKYGQFEAWLFEPHVAEQVFEEYVDRAGVEVWYSRRVASVRKQGARIVSLRFEDAGPARGRAE